MLISMFKIEMAGMQAYNTIGPASTVIGDVLLFEAFSSSDNSKVEYLANLFLSGSIPTTSQGSISIPSHIPAVINMQTVSSLSPALLTKVHLNHFVEEFIPESYLTIFITARLSWEQPWMSIMERLSQAFSDNVVQQIVFFIKKNKEPTALVYWNNDMQFYKSLSLKIVAAVRELEALYPIEVIDQIKSREVLTDFTSDIECCLVFCLITEVENHLRSFMQVGASKFLVETIRVAHDNNQAKPESSSSSNSSSRSSSSGSSAKATNFGIGSKIVPGHERKNVAMINLIATLEAKPRETIFNYCYDIRKRKWVQWIDYERISIHQLEQRELVNRNFEPSSAAIIGKRGAQLNFTQSGNVRASRKSFSNFGMANSPMPSKNIKITSLAIPELTKVEFWCLLLSRYGMPFSCLSNNPDISNVASRQIRQTMSNRQISLVKAECELLFNKNSINKFTSKRLINPLSPIVVLV